MIYGIDFDGTIVEEKFPAIGKPIKEVVDFIRTLKKEGHKWILITMRQDKQLEEAIEWLYKMGLTPDAVNDNLPERIEMWGNNPRKIYADVYIDDHNAGGVQLPEIVHTYPLLNELCDELEDLEEGVRSKMDEVACAFCQEVVPDLEKYLGKSVRFAYMKEGSFVVRVFWCKDSGDECEAIIHKILCFEDERKIPLEGIMPIFCNCEPVEEYNCCDDRRKNEVESMAYSNERKKKCYY